MRADGHPPRRVPCRKKGTKRKSAANAFGDRHDIRNNAKQFIGKKLAGSANTGLHLVEHQKQTMRVAKITQRPQKVRRRGADAALALNRLNQNGAGLRTDRGFHRLDVAKGNRVETWDLGPEAL